MPTSISCKTAGIFRFQQPTNKNNLKTDTHRQIKTTPLRSGQISIFFAYRVEELLDSMTNSLHATNMTWMTLLISSDL